MLSKRARPYDPEQIAPNKRLAANLRDLSGSNALSGERLFSILEDARAGGNAGLPSKMGKSKSNRARNIRKSFLKRNQWPALYYAGIRLLDPKTDTIVAEQVGFLLPHELIESLHRYGNATVLQSTVGMDPKTLDHLNHCRQESGDPRMLGGGLHGDGVPCNWDRTRSTETVSTNLPGLADRWKGLRMPNVAIPHDRFCEHTWDDVMDVLQWSWSHASAGVSPLQRHDNAGWRATDNARSKVAGTSLRYRCCLCEVRGDWKFYAECFHFKTWNYSQGICWKCRCTLEQVISLSLTLSLPLSVSTYTLIYT